MLQALFQAVSHEGKNLHEVELLKTSLLRSCTPEGQTALSQDVQTLLHKKKVLEKSIHKHLDHLQSQNSREMEFEVSIKDSSLSQVMGSI